MEGTWNVYKNSILNSKGRRPFGRPRRRWEDNSKINLKNT
jgi:hypothetical protein